MNAYSPIEGGQFSGSSRTERRRLLFWLLNWYDVVAAGITLAIVILVVGPLIPHSPWLLTWPTLYVGYACLRLAAIYRVFLWKVVTYLAGQLPQPLRESVRSRLLTGRDRVMPVWLKCVGLWERSRWFSRFFAIALVLGAGVFMVSVWQVDIAAGRQTGDIAVWLLLIPPIRLTAQKDSLWWILGIGGLAILADAGANVLVANAPLHFLISRGIVRLVGIQALWLMLICLLPLILLRYLTEREAGLIDAIDVVQEIAGLHRLQGQKFANAATAIIARRLGFDEANILLAISRHDASGEGLRMIGAATANGRALVEEGLTLWWEDPPSGEGAGITVWAAKHEDVCLVNDISRDPQKRYRPNPRFGNTRAELAVPILLGKTLVGVLDVQSVRRFAFTADDVNILRVIGTHLAVALENAQNLAQARGIYFISQSIARRLLLHRELRPVLEAIVHVAHEVLGADHVVLYPYNELHARYDDPVVAGTLSGTTVAPASGINAVSDSAVARIMQSGGPQFIEHSQAHAAVSAHVSLAMPWLGSFVRRAGIQSTAAIPLRLPVAASEHAESHKGLGVIFVNYLQRRTFTTEYREWCSALADLAALALQNAMLYEQVAEVERRNLWREVHDGVAQYASYGRMLLDQVIDAHARRGALGDGDVKKLELARTCSHKLQQQVNYLVGIWNDSSTTLSLFDELDEYASIVQGTLGITCESMHTGSDSAVSSKVQHEVRMVIREAVHNAIRHGLAKTVRISAQADDARLKFVVADNGAGFDSRDTTSTGGLSNIHFRIATRLKGTVWIDSQPSQGTLITAVIPLDASTPSTGHEPQVVAVEQEDGDHSDEADPAMVHFHTNSSEQ